MSDIYRKRLLELQREILKSGIDMAVLVDRENLIYYTGLTNIECMALVVPSKGGIVCITLAMDLAFIKQKCCHLNVVGYDFPQSNLGRKLVQVIRYMGFNSPNVGFSKYFVEFSVFDALRMGLKGMEFSDITDICYKIRSVKDESEVEYIRKASEFLKEGMEAAVSSIKPGMTEVQVLAEAQYAMQKAGSEGSTFRMQVLIQKRQLIIHPYAGNYTIDNNQAIVIHLGASYKGYTSKMCRTIALGRVEPETRKIYNVLVEAQDKAIHALKPGISVGAVYDAVFKVISNAGYGKNFLDIAGYGVGIRQSEFYPIIKRNGDTVIDKNMVVDLLLPTIYKKSVGGPRITDVLRVREEGAELLTEFSKKMIQK
ncbi:Xaa-Pro peptidase family protein [Clostridium sp. WLY-B-L2]|uniref:Xaa-Pro peptidase family protein n=1 Tax=Clostridium aromativorans TaxID=2836848 RepID=A0ABS8N397_9CLOT|nr:Xaa-Pro peptidase family protein [Clostridium aromativorans]MCC9293585.1 Xaa-Pro peptidase family protein [Clostridium aromativorans]